jgi:hypothetical protein
MTTIIILIYQIIGISEYDILKKLNTLFLVNNWLVL